jgi:hypothetical protein
MSFATHRHSVIVDVETNPARTIPHIPVWEKGDRQDGIFSRSDFRWDSAQSTSVATTSGTMYDGRTLLYYASKRDCDVCLIRAKGCTTTDARKIPRDLHEDGGR